MFKTIGGFFLVAESKCYVAHTYNDSQDFREAKVLCGNVINGCSNPKSICLNMGNICSWVDESHQEIASPISSILKALPSWVTGNKDESSINDKALTEVTEIAHGDTSSTVSTTLTVDNHDGVITVANHILFPIANKGVSVGVIPTITDPNNIDTLSAAPNNILFRVHKPKEGSNLRKTPLDFKNRK